VHYNDQNYKQISKGKKNSETILLMPYNY